MTSRNSEGKHETMTNNEFLVLLALFLLLSLIFVFFWSRGAPLLGCLLDVLLIAVPLYLLHQSSSKR